MTYRAVCPVTANDPGDVNVFVSIRPTQHSLHAVFVP